MLVTLLGVRGSTPAPGAAFTRYGGHTSCVAVASDSDVGATALLLDAGTGVRDLPTLLGGRPFAGSIVLSHLHWDHVQGLPFCPSLDRPDATVELWVPTAAGDPQSQALRLMRRVMSPPTFPIGPDGLLGRWRFRAAHPGRRTLGRAEVTLAPVAHKGGLTYGIRVELDGASVAYLPDHALVDPPQAALASAQDLARGVDLLLHDGQYRDDERSTAVAYGHATLGAALGLADRCDVGRLMFIHHAPARTDDELGRLAATITATRQGRPVSFGRQGESVVVVPRRRPVAPRLRAPASRQVSPHT